MKTIIVILGLAAMSQSFVATGTAQTRGEEGGRSKIATVQPGTPVPANHSKFEYRVAMPNDTETEEQTLNKLGNEGWELVAVVGHDNMKRATYYLKRAVRE